MKITIPNGEVFEISTVVLDLNGTITIRGVLIDGLVEKISKIKAKGLRVVLLSGDTRGTARVVADKLGVELKIAKTGEEKADIAMQYIPESSIAIGNGLIDTKLFSLVKLAIVVLQAEGAHVQAILEADVVVPSILDALDLILDSDTLVATIRQ